VLSDGGANPLISTANAQTVALQGAIPNSGTGITFPATQSASSNANTLDDYEEGTWTPASSSAMTGTYGASGKYTKIGNSVYCTGTMSYTGLTGSDVTISGLPFTNGSVRQATVNVYLGASGASLVALVVEASDTVFYFTPTASYSGGARTAYFSCWYQV